MALDVAEAAEVNVESDLAASGAGEEVRQYGATRSRLQDIPAETVPTNRSFGLGLRRGWLIANWSPMRGK